MIALCKTHMWVWWHKEDFILRALPFIVMRRIITIVEGAAFVLPAVPSSLLCRLSILATYYMMHLYGLQQHYAAWKRGFSE